MAGLVAFASAACNAIIGVKDYVDGEEGDASTIVQMDGATNGSADSASAVLLDAGEIGSDVDDDASLPSAFDASCAPESYCALVLDAGPLAYFRFNELGYDAQARILDWSGHDASLALDGDVSVASGPAAVERQGYALSLGENPALDGGSYIFEGITAPAPEFTYEAWFEPNSADFSGTITTTEIPFRITSSPEYNFAICLGSSTESPFLAFTQAKGNGVEGQVSGPMALPLATWSHVAVTASEDGQSFVFFVDGVAGTPFFQPGGLPGVSLLPEQILSSSAMFGTIDEIAVYNRALTTAEIQAHAAYQAP